MFFIPLVVSLTSLLCSVPVSCCDYGCKDKPVFTPSRLIVKYGDSASATCTVCSSCTDLLNLERAVGCHTTNDTKITWTVHNLTEWSTTPICHYSDGVNHCCSDLLVSAYKPPDSVKFRFTPSGPMREGYNYTLQCNVKNVAPVQNLNVTFHRGQTVLGGLKISNSKKEPVSEPFFLNITASREHNGAQYWCEAKLELGPDGPRHPPVVKSQNITANVLYMPHVERPSHPDPIVYTVGDHLQLNCSAKGNPPLFFTWWPPLPELPRPSRNATTYTTESVSEQDEGQYVCQISNFLGSVNTTFNVKVKAKTTTTAPTTTTTTAPTTTTTTAPTTTTTTAATTTATTTTPTTTQTTTKLTTAPSSSTSITLTRWFITWFMILFSLVI